MQLDIPGPAGVLEALVDEPATDRGVNREGLVEAGVRAGVRAAVVFAHPHPQRGGTMHTKAVFQSAKALARIGCAVVRFNFRGVGRSTGTWDEGAGEMDDFRAALEFTRARYPNAPLWTAGMSFGSWIALTAGAQDPRVSTLLGIATAVCRYDFSLVRDSQTPKFFIHGERDEICSMKDIREFYARAADPKELVVIDGADHVFDGKVGDVADAVEELLGDWGAGESGNWVVADRATYE
jgi:alpha/beta superfamily hydrolase